MSSQPQKTPIVQKPSPVVLDQLLIETEDSNSAPFDRMLEYGHIHPDQTKYPNHLLLKQGPNAYGVYQRIWGTSPVLQDTYNVEKGFSEDSSDYPTFTRSYRVLRSAYLVDGPATKLQPFTGIIAVKVTAGGSGYTKDFAVSFSGGGGTGATGLAIVNNKGGAVVRVEIMSVGAGYTTAPAVVFSAGNGTGAAGTSAIQPAAAVLTVEKHGKLPEDDAYYSLFDRVVRLYETLPGPSMTSTKYDPVSNTMVPVTKTKKAYADIVEGVEMATVDGVSSFVITESEKLSDDVGIETKTVLPQPAAHDEDSAIISEECLPFQFPGTLNVAVWLANSGAIGTAPPFIRRVPHIKKVFWVISGTRPALGLNGLIDFSEQKGLLGADLSETVYDATTFAGYSFPGSVPNLTNYLADWVGGDPRSVLGSVRQDGGKFRWRVERIFVQFIVLRPTTV